MITICIFCLKEDGHTSHCEELRTKPVSNLFTVQYHLLRATMSNYKAQGGEPNKYLASMWENSANFWCEGVAKMIASARDAGKLKEIYMPEA